MALLFTCQKRSGNSVNLKNVHAEAQTAWKNVYKGNKEKLEEFLALQKNEDSFVRYFFITTLCTFFNDFYNST